MIELKKCPFCGATASIMDVVVLDRRRELDAVAVVCNVCKARSRPFYTRGQTSPISYTVSEKLAAEAWNIRTEE